jgi:hypothetical protein
MEGPQSGEVRVSRADIFDFLRRSFYEETEVQSVVENRLSTTSFDTCAYFSG